ncbi:MAG: alanine:cation symporter family protein, partial [Planctomycetota bacterium]
GLEPFIDTIVVCTLTALVILSSGAYNRGAEATFLDQSSVRVVQATNADGDVIEGSWTIETPTLPPMTEEARTIRRANQDDFGWRSGETIFIVLAADVDPNTGRDLRKLTGQVSKNTEFDEWEVAWSNLESESVPTLRTKEDGTPDLGLYGEYSAASLTAYAFDRVTPGLGMWLISIAAWMFAISTMISWSYYGEQGIYYFFGSLGDKAAKPAVLIYKLVYCSLILLTTVLAMPIFEIDGQQKAIIGTDAELDMWTTLGLGVMLVANIPIMWIFGAQAMKAYHGYFRKLKEGGDKPHEAPPLADVVEGKDVE